MEICCVYCGKKLDTDEDEYRVGESLGEYWCDECSYYDPDEN